MRLGRRAPQPLRVLLDEFVAPGRFEVVSAPEVVAAADEETAVPLRIVVRRVIVLPKLPPGQSGP